MTSTVKVMRSGNNDVVVLPSWWRRAHGISVGDALVVRENPDSSISFASENETRARQAVEKLDVLRSQVPKSDFLKSLTPNQLKEELPGRDWAAH